MNEVSRELCEFLDICFGEEANIENLLKSSFISHEFKSDSEQEIMAQNTKHQYNETGFIGQERKYSGLVKMIPEEREEADSSNPSDK